MPFLFKQPYHKQRADAIAMLLPFFKEKSSSVKLYDLMCHG